MRKSRDDDPGRHGRERRAQAGGRDVFVHMFAVECAGLSTLNEGQHIEYEIEENRGKTSAVVREFRAIAAVTQ